MPIAHYLLQNNYPFPGKIPRVYCLRNGRCCSVRGSSQTLQPQRGRSASTSQQLTSFHLSKNNPSCLAPAERPLLLVSPNIDHAAPSVLAKSFCLRFNNNPPRQEAHRRPTSKHFSRKFVWSMPLWPKPQIDKCHFLSLKLSTLCYALMNSIVPSTNQLLPLLEQLTQRTRDSGKLLQSPYFLRPLTPTLWTPPPLPTGILYSPQFRSHRETKMAARRTQWSGSTISLKNRGLWTV